jgi:hypothetical protein
MFSPSQQDGMGSGASRTTQHDIATKPCDVLDVRDALRPHRRATSMQFARCSLELRGVAHLDQLGFHAQARDLEPCTSSIRNHCEVRIQV